MSAALFALATLNFSMPLEAQSGPSTIAEKLPLVDLMANKDNLTNRKIAVEGVLVNRGTNYFTDMRLVLIDPQGSPGAEVLVRPWLPTELPPPQGTNVSRSTLSEYLGKKVLIEGVLTDDVVKNVGRTKILRVDSVRAVD